MTILRSPIRSAVYNPLSGPWGGAGVPAQFSPSDWSVSDDETSGDITISVTSLPSSDAAITDLEYQLDGGSWVSMAGTTTGDYAVAGLTDDQEYDVAIRAVSSAGNGTASATKAVTPTAPAGFTKVGELAFDVAVGTGTEAKTLPGTLAAGDLVLIVMASDSSLTNASSGGGINDVSYTTLEQSAAATPGHILRYKVMGETPDTEVSVFQQSSWKQSGILQIWRGADASTPIDDTPTKASGGTGMPAPPSFTTVTAGALRILVGMLDDEDQAGSTTAPSTYGDLVASDTGQSSTAVGATAMIASKVAASAGAEAPAAFGGSGDDAYVAYHFALRPA